MRRISPLLLLAVVIAVLAAGYALRRQLGIGIDPESIRDWVVSLGWMGPAIYLAVVAFRSVLFLPSWVLLVGGGLCFGVVIGTLLGGLGVALSALMQFAVARGIGREWVSHHVSRRLSHFERRFEGVEALVVAGVTAHPMGPMSVFHLGAGLTSISVLAFLLAVTIGAPIRAFALAFLGESLLEIGSPRFFAATGVLLACVVLPFAHPAVRRRVFGRPPTGEAP